ncbi:MAG: cytochrome c maturation protein CcmE [Proteobacteria bacterium]|nr:cytochrome c maturation protein CcmE [Pseudomonadota bacterium]
MSKGVQIALATLTVFAALAVLIALGSSEEGTFPYYENVEAYLGSERADDASLRVHGFVVEGTIVKDLRRGHVDFHISDPDSEGRLAVRYLGIDVPDLFREGAEVVVEGRTAGETFLARRVMAKCPSKYEVAPAPRA